MKSLYFIRHGQSKANVAKTYAGWDDTPLTDEGRERARTAGLRLMSKEIDRVIASDLRRAAETARIVCEAFEFKGQIEFDQRIREVNVGDLVGQPTRGMTGYLEAESIEGNPYHVERFSEITDRLSSFLEYLEQQPDQTILVVGHNGTGSELLKMINKKLNRAELEEVAISNATLIKVL
jgi:broad specificity phosphatase PhoE